MSDTDLTTFIEAQASILALSLPPACRDGVIANMRLLLRHAALVAAADEPMLDPAELLAP